MTMGNELTVQEAALAWAQGKKVEARFADGGAWYPIAPVGGQSGYVFNARVFSEDSVPVLFRLATEPPAKRYRPWTPEEVPVGAQIRHANWEGAMYGRFAIIGVNARSIGWVCVSGFGGATLAEAANDSGFTHSTDNGKTWLPCGVEVES